MRQINFTLFIVWILPESPAAAEPPKVLDPHYTLELVAAEPDIVTPVGMGFDAKGRLLVIESHTHFRPPDYKGPPADRIRVLEDADGDGRAETFHTFFEGTEFTMSLAPHRDGSVYVATRMKVFRLRDTDGDGKADEELTIARLETPGNYPHNGLCGLAFDNDGKLLFGLGENLGEPYRLIGSDGTTLAGGGEGGNVYRCEADGKGLMRVATGFWNPFGICVDAHGRVFCVENDPDSCPPCRLVQVVGGGDYGFQFRYGRAGIHPLQAWDGELPGTLPMVTGTGEAPCEVRVYRGELWVTSWGDNRIEAYALQPRGAAPEGAFPSEGNTRWGRASRRVVVQGGENFRPVGLAVGPDGALYFSDWVDRSYPLHGKGRVWRLRPKGEPPARPYPALTGAEKRARALETKPDLEALKDADPFVRQAAVWGLIRNGDPASIDWQSLSDPRQRLGVLQALRWKEEAADTILPKALRDPDPDVRLAAVRWVADRGMRQYRDLVAGQLKRADGTLALFKAAATALPWLDRRALTVGDRRRGGEELFLSLLGDGGQQPALRAWALRSLPPDHPSLGTDRLRNFLRGDEPALRREAVWTLALSQRPERFELLALVARDESLPAELRADAVMGLAGAAERYEELLLRLSRSGNASLRKEALRSLRFARGRHEAAAAESQPAPEDIDAWMKLAEGSGDPDAGRRVFFSAAGARCASCHAVDGRGADVGPDLTRTGRRLSRRRLLESILQPSREVAPMYRAWLLEMADGRTLTGSALGPTDKGRKERFVDAEGKVFVVPVAEIESRRQTDVSIMPQGLEKPLTPEDLRDLLAFLEGKGQRPER